MAELKVYSGESEQEIKKQIMTFLRYQRVFCWINSSTGIYDPTRGVFRKNNSLFQLKGVSDILGIFKGRLLAIEVKSKVGRLSPEQKYFLEQVQHFGGIAFVARSVKEVEDVLFAGVPAMV